MFLGDGLVFLELQKTGGSHICRLLTQYANGRLDGKHNRLLGHISDQYIIGSIRNPWDWYVSLWAYGVSEKGAIRARTAKGFDLDYYYRMLPKDMGKNWLTAGEFLVAAYYDIVKPVSRWQQTYQDFSDAECFRRWLKLILDKKHRFDIGEGYGFSPLSNYAGLLTYRYFRLFTIGDGIYHDKRLLANVGLGDFDRSLNIAHGVIRTESLEDDFIRVLGEAGVVLTDEQCSSIRQKEAGKTNTSERKSAAYYYDDETLALVAKKESYLIEKYRYVAPEL